GRSGSPLAGRGGGVVDHNVRKHELSLSRVFRKYERVLRTGASRRAERPRKPWVSQDSATAGESGRFGPRSVPFRSVSSAPFTLTVPWRFGLRRCCSLRRAAFRGQRRD